METQIERRLDRGGVRQHVQRQDGRVDPPRAPRPIAKQNVQVFKPLD